MIRTARRRAAGFTLTEVMASLAASVIVIGGLIVSSTDTHRVLVGSERYAEAYSQQRRLIDYLARDLRRALVVEQETAAGLRLPLAGRMILENGCALVVRLPGYYRAQRKADAAYMDALDVMATPDRLDYGTAAGLADPVEVIFRKRGLGFLRGVGFVRVEAGSEEVIVDDALELHAEVEVSPATRVAQIHASYRSPYRGIGLVVTSHDEVLLRNPPLDFRP